MALSRKKRAPSWEEMFKQLKTFKEEHGHLMVPKLGYTTTTGIQVDVQGRKDNADSKKNSKIDKSRF
jgi:hypothetical protein